MKTFTHKERSEVDIRVQQEIKNHKDLMYEAHQKINALNEGMISLSIQHEKSKAQLANDGKAILIAFENLKEGVDSLLKHVTSKIGDMELKLFNILDEFNDLQEEVSVNYIAQEEFEESLASLESIVASHHLKQTLKNENFNQYLLNIQARATEDLIKLREELTPKPPEVDPVKAQLDDRFKVWKVDFDGLVREIAILKRDVAYDQKKFENVYTLIERLKEGKECHKKA